MHPNLGRWTHGICRIVVGLLFMEHGLQKLFGILGGVAQPGGTVPLMSQLGVAGMLEFGGGILLILGLLTRPMAALLCLEMVIAYLQVHAPRGGFPVQNEGELALLYASVFLFLAGNGPGAFSLDSVVRNAFSAERRHAPPDRRHMPVAA